MKHVLFVCTGNAGRSQMAEALFRAETRGEVEVSSAGVDPWDDLHPMARKLMTERGLDLAGHVPKHVNQFVDTDLDLVVTIGDRAEAESPGFRTGVHRIHWPIDDPADADGTPESEHVFRNTCRRIEQRLNELPVMLNALAPRSALAGAPGISTCVFRPGSLDPAEHLPMLARAGFECIELCCYKANDFAWTDRSAVREVARVAADCGVTIAAVHPPDSGTLGTLDDAARRTQEDVLRRAIDLASELGAGTVSVHAGFRLPVDETRARALELQDEVFDRLEPIAAASPAVLCLESLSGRPTEVSNPELVQQVQQRSAAAFGFVLDTGHAHMAGNLRGLARRAGRRLQNLHLHDNDGQGDAHRVPGRGRIDWAAFMTELEAAGYEGPIMLEVEASEDVDVGERLRLCRAAVDRLNSWRLQPGQCIQ